MCCEDSKRTNALQKDAQVRPHSSLLFARSLICVVSWGDSHDFQLLLSNSGQATPETAPKTQKCQISENRVRESRISWIDIQRVRWGGNLLFACAVLATSVDLHERGVGTLR